MKFKFSNAVTTFFALTTVGLAGYAVGQANGNSFPVQDIRYDESMGKKLPLPTFPKSWKLVSVSNGEKSNTNTLWFQSPDGNVYMLSGFTDGREFIIDGTAWKLNAR